MEARAGSVLGFGQCWEGRAGLCAHCSKAELPGGLIWTGAILPWTPSGQPWGVPLLLSALCILRDMAHERQPQCTQDSALPCLRVTSGWGMLTEPAGASPAGQWDVPRAAAAAAPAEAAGVGAVVAGGLHRCRRSLMPGHRKE